ncbi:gluconate 2-dehydrogenase subunit 3 family protein [Colwellia sp. E2M01]|uniref:gluconate 2-dehydrogenase subunit 3 family protein n=1 Tax=Colwellia sp. E2M01 TaxID=2841561 RepID=UPI001C080145|nr:gluconate 2-dehydrogenase subunit 3 family protein [Colwellia sp. E2M01]MBU2871679.1 gluconate 2-dehydrogenase subunit 3 family protein [Colwellia sp. E2M01]
MNINKCRSFFDKHYKTPAFIVNQQHKKHATNDRRHFLKAAAGVSVMSGLSAFSIAAFSQSAQLQLNELVKTDPWLTLDATLNHLLPESPTGPSAIDINATAYLVQIMTVQPTPQDEKEFILKGVGWLNGYAMSEKSANFAQLSFADKEQLLRGISKSRAGKNWLNTLLGYIFQAMLAPPSYGGNPKGIGWQWLEHQAGFPLPEQGQRYFELPKRARIDLISHVNYQQKRKVSTARSTHSGTRKT